MTSANTAPVAAPTEADLLIVGAGPAGLFACFYAGLRVLSVILLDSLPHLGGQVAALYPDKDILDVAGFPAVTGRDLTDRLIEQARRAEPEILLSEQAEKLEHEDDRVVVTTGSGRRIEVGAVLVTAGVGSFTPRSLPALDAFTGSGIHYVAAAPDEYCDKHVVVVGGGDSAVDWANTLTPLARSVTLVHRRARFRAHEMSVTQLRNSSAQVLTHSEIAMVHGDRTVDGITVQNSATGHTARVDADVVIAALGNVASLGAMTSWGLRLTGQQIEVGTDMSTGVNRVYAAGDISTYPGKVRLIAVAFGEAATAVNNIGVLLRPDQDLFPGHSTDKASVLSPIA
jgi:ferredoxin/flavodoxin---NADP+ reductase